ncbi:MAG: tetratricopeptide repeat protein [Bacteroidetes bacterium]|nr:tetratricopeptide repeat protein [Bacteroidota bacterium]
MLKTRLILIFVSALIIWLIFMLPKAVVENENQLAATDSTESGKPIPSKGHSDVPVALSNAIKSLRAQYLQGSPNQKNAIFADSLRSLYTQAGQFDSAAWYAEQSATFFKTTESFLKAGNSYYEAYTFSMGAEKQQTMALKAQEYLGKVIEANPKNFEARTKMAMTYLSSSPMQGIQKIRDVLAEDPKNEFALYNLGMLSMQSGQYDRAIERLNDLIGVNPNHVQGQLLLGVAYLNAGNKEKAKAQFEKVKKLDSDPAVQSTADSYLQELKVK